MKKLLVCFATITLLAPNLTLANPQCQKLTDEQYRQQLISQPVKDIETEDGVTFTTTGYFFADNRFNMDLDLSTALGYGKIHFKGTWVVNNANITLTFKQGSYDKTGDYNFDSMLAQAVNMQLSLPPQTESLQDCVSNKFTLIRK